MKGVTKWTATTKYVDTETGQIISKHQFKKYYIKIKTLKHAKYTTESKAFGTIEYTIECRRNPQTRLFE